MAGLEEITHADQRQRQGRPGDPFDVRHAARQHREARQRHHGADVQGGETRTDAKHVQRAD
jgi:hypothetical protein